MPSGGARARSGPPPDPMALRRERDNADWIHLPATGRLGRSPRWPLDGQTQRERTLWRSEWKRPQAVQWEANGQELEVAIYVRTLAEAERPSATANLRTLLRQQMDALGLTVPGLARNRWVIGHGAPSAQQQVKRADERDRTSAKARFRSIAGGAAS